jgi:hypothetical protein
MMFRNIGVIRSSGGGALDEHHAASVPCSQSTPNSPTRRCA